MINQIVNQQKFYSNIKKISILYKLFLLQTFFTKFKKNSISCSKILSLLQKFAAPASKFGSPDLELLMSDSALNKVVQQIGVVSLFSLELLVDGLSITFLSISLPINRSLDDTTFYGTNNGIGLFSDSTHSIKTAIAILGLFFRSHSPFSSFFLLVSNSLFSHPFYSELCLLGRTKSFMISFNFLWED